MISETLRAEFNLMSHSPASRRRASASEVVALNSAPIFALTISRATLTESAAHCARMIDGSMPRIRIIVFVLVSSAVSTIVVSRPGPPGNARLIE